jgi:hypothetical protein
MRSEADIIFVEATISRRLTFDLERLEQDPVWVQVLQQSQTEPETVSLEECMSRYLRYYIQRDRFPHQTPTTNGPGDIGEVNLEIKWPQ